MFLPDGVPMDRRSAVRALIGTVAAVLTGRELRAEVLPPVVVYRNPGCPCCEKWKQLMAAAGFKIIMKEDCEPCCSCNIARRTREATWVSHRHRWRLRHLWPHTAR